MYCSSMVADWSASGMIVLPAMFRELYTLLRLDGALLFLSLSLSLTHTQPIFRDDRRSLIK